MYIHNGLAKGVCLNGFDPHRPRVGCVIELTSVEGREQLKKATRAARPPQELGEHLTFAWPGPEITSHIMVPY